MKTQLISSLVNFLLLAVAIGLAIPFFPIGVLVMLLNAIRERSVRRIIAYLSQTALSLALSIDAMGNVVCRDFLNGACRKNGGYDFGHYQDTISRVLGKNKALGTLTDFGRLLANLLNWIQPNHVETAAR